MKQFFKKLFCKHIFKTISTEFLRESRESYGKIQGIPHYSNYEYHAHTSKCIKCDKIKITEKRILVF